MSDHVLTDTLFESFDLHPLLVQGLSDCGFTRCTPIQALTLPVALAGRDVAGQAQTGTGKTCAFLVTLMNHLLTRPARAARKDADPRALVIAPTRELAIQIDKDARAIGAHTGLKTALIYGGVDYDKQRQMLRDGCDIVIATPGRMLDYHKQHVFRLDNVEVMVVDEADRMFDLGFIKDVRYIFHRIPPRDERQVLLYSATLSLRVLELAYEHMHEAEKLVAEADAITAEHVHQVVYFPSKEEKIPLLLNLMARDKPERALVFVNTRAATERVRDRLKRYGYRVGGLSGDVPQVKRQKLLQRFKDGQLDTLVCTDVAARGLHIPHVSHVFNYDLPQDAEDYVHRIGRTARLGEEGDAISFACDLYAVSLPDIESFIEQKIPVAAIEPEWLAMPKAPPASEIHDDHTEPGAAGAEAASSSSHKRRRRDGRGHSGTSGHAGATQEGAHANASRAPSPAGKMASVAHADAGVAGNHAAAGGDSGSQGSPRKRRHRGGRNRHRNEHSSGNPSVGQAAARSSVNDPSGASSRTGGRRGAVRDNPRKGDPGTPRRSQQEGNGASHREVSAAAPVSGLHPKSTQVKATPAGGPKQRSGFLRRLADGLFGGR